MNCELISVGTEMLTGAILNTNVRYLSRELSGLGIRVLRHTTVGDNPKRLDQALRTALTENDLVILTGGLGPTQDDLTRETAAEVLGRKLRQDPELVKFMKSWFAERHLELTENNLRQTMVPEGARVLKNPDGTAPGILFECDDKMVILLPGPPHEMQTVFEGSVRAYLTDKNKLCVDSRYYHMTGIGESKVEDVLYDLVDGQTNPTLATYAKPGEVLVRLTASGMNAHHNTQLLDRYENIIKQRLEDHIFSYSQQTLLETVAAYMIDHHFTVSCAESCTAGMICSELASVPGISESLLLGVVSYSNEAKMNVLHVKKETLEKYGAVSEQTAAEMCENVRKLAGSDIGVSTTGIAGPDGGTPEKPVGLVYTGICVGGKTIIKENRFFGDRETVRRKAVNMILQMIRAELFKQY